jgi:type VI secretion system protein ImpJ
MFLLPHHFQAADRYAARLVDQNTRFARWHTWGFRRCVVDPDALGAFRFVVRELEARFRDGTTINLPEDAPPPDIDLKPAFLGRSTVDLYLGVSKWRSGQPNVSTPSATSPGRYKVGLLPTEDENTGVNPKPLSFRAPDVRVLMNDDDQSGYEVLPLARLEKSERAEATPRLSTGFIPPVMVCDAWPGLQESILQELYFRLNKKIEVLAGQVTSRGISFDSHSPGDGRRMYKLAAMNEGYSVLANMAFTAGVHPWDAYVELTRMVGKLAILGRAARPPQVPQYDHDDPSKCFWTVKQHIDALLEGDDPTYEERPFIGSGLRMQVTLESAWLESSWQMFLGVRSNVSNEECVKMLTRPERLGMKIGSSDRVDTIFTKGQEGLRFKPNPLPPRDLPSAPNLTYFDISRDSTTNEWAYVQKAKTLAIRIKEGDVVGSIDGQRDLTIRTSGQPTTFSFTLYLVPAK